MGSVPHDLPINLRMVYKWPNRSIFVINDISIIVSHDNVDASHDMCVVDVSLLELVLAVGVPNSHVLGQGTPPYSPINLICQIVKLFLEDQVWLSVRPEALNGVVVLSWAQNWHVVGGVCPEVLVVRKLLSENCRIVFVDNICELEINIVHVYKFG